MFIINLYELIFFMKKINTQDEWIKRANEVLPAAGFGNFENDIIIKSGKGSKVWDEDNNEYIDYLIGSGPMLLGHGHPEVMEAIFEQLPKGMTFFANNSKGIELAEEICKAVKCSEKVRFVSSGGEADMYAMRLARAYTGKDKILKFEGGYHGMSAEAQMSLSPSNLVNFPQPIPDSAGIPKNIEKDVLIAPFNDLEFIKSIVAEYKDEIAGVIVEPLQRIVPPLPGFLEGLKKICSEKSLEKVTRTFFNQRRKKIKKPFNQLFNNSVQIAKKLNIDLDLRPQNLSVDTYLLISKEYENLRG